MGSFLYLFSISAGLMAAVFYVIIKKSAQDKAQRIILTILILVFVMEYIGRYTSSRGINNSLLYNIGWVYIESLLLIFYFFTIEKVGCFKKWIKIFALAILLLGLFNTIYLQPVSSQFQYYTFLPFGLLIIYLCLRFLIKILNFRIYQSENLITLPHFWIVTGMLFFYCEALILFGIFQLSPNFILNNFMIFGNIN